jgi:hypothetical protein
MAPDVKKKVMIGGAVVGAVALGAYALSRPKGSEQSGLDPAMLAGLFLGGSAATGGGGGAIPMLSDAALMLPEIEQENDAMFANFFNALPDLMRRDSDNSLFTALGLKGGQTASLFHDAGGSYLSINNPAPSYSSADIRNFIDTQARAGVPINAASIVSWSQQYNVPLERIGAAYGKTPQQAYDWLRQNDPSIKQAQPSQMTYTFGAPTPATLSQSIMAATGTQALINSTPGPFVGPVL